MKKFFKCLMLTLLTSLIFSSVLVLSESSFAASPSSQYPVDRLPEAVYDVEYEYLKGGNAESPDGIIFFHNKMAYPGDKRIEKANSTFLYSIYDAYESENGNFVKYTGKNGVYNVLDSKNKKIGTISVSKDYKTLVISVVRSSVYKQKLAGTYTGNPKKVMTSIKEVYGFYPMDKTGVGLDRYLVISDKGIQIAKRDFASSKVSYEKAVAVKYALKNGLVEIKEGCKGNITRHIDGKVDIILDSISNEYIIVFDTKKFNSLNDVMASKEVKNKILLEKSFVDSLEGKELVMPLTGGKVVLGKNKILCTQVTISPMLKEEAKDFEVLGHAFRIDPKSFYSSYSIIEGTLVDDKGNVIATLRFDDESKKLIAVDLMHEDKEYNFY